MTYEQIINEQRLNLIAKFAKRNRKSKPSFATVMHEIEKVDRIDIGQSMEGFQIDTHLVPELDDSFSQAFG